MAASLKAKLPFWCALVAAGLCWSVASPREARAQNGLTNPDFDAGIAGWSAVDGALSWNAGVDVNGCPGSGAAVVGSPAMVSGNWTVTLVSTGSCVPVTPGGSVALWARVLPGAAVAHTDFAVLGYTDANCSTGETEHGIAGYGTLPQIWLDIMLGLGVDGSTNSVRFLMRSYDAANSTFHMTVDRVYAGAASPVFLDAFGAGSTCRWSAVTP